MRYKLSPAGGSTTRSGFTSSQKKSRRLRVSTPRFVIVDVLLRIVLLKMSEDLRTELEKFLETLNIQTSCVEHPPVKRFRFPADRTVTVRTLRFKERVLNTSYGSREGTRRNFSSVLHVLTCSVLL